MRVFGKVVIATVVTVAAGAARADEFTFSFHEASGGGTANLFDGGPPRSDSVDTVVSDDPDIGFFAVDSTRPGSFGASAVATGRSQIFDLLDEDGIRVRVSLSTVYLPSLFAGGDNPGGMAEASLSSLIEFVMPTDELNWTYGLSTFDTNRFEGSTSVLFENVTRSQTLLTLTSKNPGGETILSGDIGDVMRITTLMSGSGSTDPASKKQYTSTLDMWFVIPEPTTILLLALRALPLTKRKRAHQTRT